MMACFLVSLLISCTCIWRDNTVMFLKENENKNSNFKSIDSLNEPPHGKTNNLHGQKQRRRSALRS